MPNFMKNDQKMLTILLTLHGSGQRQMDRH